MTYHVTAKRWSGGWELHIDGVGVTQSTTLAGARKAVRSYLAMDDHTDADTARIELTPALGEHAQRLYERARAKAKEAERLQREAAAEQREAVRELKDEGLTGSDVAEVLGVSTQRVSQLVKT